MGLGGGRVMVLRGVRMQGWMASRVARLRGVFRVVERLLGGMRLCIVRLFCTYQEEDPRCQ
jgi:hypothetical protein